MSGRRGNENALSHGAYAPARIVRVARAQKRRFLAQAGLRANDLDGVSRALLDNWARAQAKVELLDRHFEERGGLLDDGGEPLPATRIYFTALNSARLALARLSERVGRLDADDPLAVLEAEGRRIAERRLRAVE